MNNQNIFYNYVYLDPRKSGTYQYGNYKFDYEPFYVGKGKNNQYLSHLIEAKENRSLNGTSNKHKYYKIKNILNENLEPIILKVEENLLEKDALDLEIWLIWSIGRYDLELGSLTNLTNGGDGVSGQIFTEKRKEECRSRCILNNPMKNPKIAKKLSGLNSPSKRKTFRERMKLVKSKKWLLTTPTGTNIIITNLSDFCKENNLNRESLYFANKRNISYKGWFCKSLSPENKYKDNAFKNLKGNKSSSKRPDVKEKIAIKSKGNTYGAKKYVVTNPEGNEEIIFNLTDFCRKNNLSIDCMAHVIGGNTKQHKGYKVRKLY